MKQFFKFFFASLLAIIIGIFLFFIIAGAIISALISGASKKEVSISSGSILKISLTEQVHERTSSNPFENFSFSEMEGHQQSGMNDILKCIDKAASDDRIKGIYIDASSVQTGMAQTEEIRNALLKFRKSGKFVYAWSDEYDQKSYYLSSAADKIFVNPQGAVELHGLMTQLMFLKGTFEKLDIEPVLIRHGKYKSAGETFVMDKMSEENRNQISSFVNDIWKNMLADISKSRNISVDELQLIADSLKSRTAYDAYRLKLVDKVCYYDEFINEINNKAGNSNNSKLPAVSVNKYKNAPSTVKKPFTSDRIAVIYAEGEIRSDGEDEYLINAARTAEAIRKARTDDDVKAIVLRVNSPGGSALASEVIWRETILAGKQKPLVVSMSDVAASGGYYISCGAKKIFVQRNTITGSIGVFGLLLNIQNMLKNKLGITMDGYKTNTYTDLGLPTKPVSEGEKRIIQASVDSVYETFTSRVSAGRTIPKPAVDSLGQGRVWSGTAALANQLADTTGGLMDAIEYASSLARLSNYRLKELPEQKDPVTEILTGLSGNAQMWFAERNMGVNAPYIRMAKEVISSQGVRMHMGYSVEIR